VRSSKGNAQRYDPKAAATTHKRTEKNGEDKNARSQNMSAPETESAQPFLRLDTLKHIFHKKVCHVFGFV
jgi:hypothetical protein